MTQIIFQAIVACCCIYTAYRLSLFIFRRLKDISASRSPESGFYKSIYLVNYPVGNRIQVYINKENHSHIKRFLAVTAPEVPISGFVNRIIDEHLKKYEHEMSKLYTECITKPL